MTCLHPLVTVLDSMPPIRICGDCNAHLPLTEQDKQDYRDYTGHDYDDWATV